MKARICTLAVTAVAAIVVPVSGAMIPPDPTTVVFGNGTRAPQVIVKQAPKHATKVKLTKRTVGSLKSPTGVYSVGAYNPHAYVPGGASPAVAKAIQAQGMKALR
jgi:hypothetical protein